MATKVSEGKYTGEFLLSEANGAGRRSRDNVTVTVPAATKFQAGHVLAKLSATGKYVDYDNAGSDGSETAYAILYTGELDNSAGGAPADFEAVVINLDAEVRKGDLEWKSGLVDADKTAAYTDLRANGIKARD